LVNQPINILPFLNPGRLVLVKDDDVDFGWGIIVNFSKTKVPAAAAPLLQEVVKGDEMVTSYVVDVLLCCKLTRTKGSRKATPTPCSADDKEAEMMVVPVLLPTIAKLSSLRLYIPKDLKSKANKNAVGTKLAEVHRRFPKGIAALDPVDDMKMKDESYMKMLRKEESLDDRLKAHELHSAEPEVREEQMRLYAERQTLEAQIGTIRQELKNATQDVVLRQTLKGMKRVLRRLGFTTRDNVIDLKGRVACEISTGDELLAVELMFSGMFNDLKPELLVSLCSVLVFEEKNDEKVRSFSSASPLPNLPLPIPQPPILSPLLGWANASALLLDDGKR
jgi:ATP-dependent RNA helicase DOB1